MSMVVRAFRPGDGAARLCESAGAEIDLGFRKCRLHGEALEKLAI